MNDDKMTSAMVSITQANIQSDNTQHAKSDIVDDIDCNGNPNSKFSDHLRELDLSIRDCSWEQLQQRFVQEMDERSHVETDIQKETTDLLEVSVLTICYTLFPAFGT